MVKVTFRTIASLVFLCALCAALIARVREDVINKLHFDENSRKIGRWSGQEEDHEHILRTKGTKPSDTRSLEEEDFGSYFTDLEVSETEPDGMTSDENFNINSMFKFIVNGKESLRNRYPYLVSVMRVETYFFFFTRKYHMCGASLIAPDVVLCAAHCVYQDNAKYVQIGEHDLSSTIEGIETFAISEYALHPDWNPKTYDYDIAILKLPGKSSRRPVRLIGVKERLVPDEPLTIMGWGTTSFQGQASEVLLEVEVNVVSASICRQRYRSLILDSMMCAHGDGGKDACQGDSGGPLIRKDKRDDPDMDVQVAVVSWGHQCAHPNYPGVYARLNMPEVRNFIDQMVCVFSPESCHKKASTLAPTPTPPNVTELYSSSSWLRNKNSNCRPDEKGSFLASGDHMERTCEWVRTRMNRCNRYSEFCPDSCCKGKCDPVTGLCTQVF